MESKSDDSSVETLFYEKLQNYIDGLNVKFRNKFTIDAETYEHIKEALAEESGVQCRFGARFKYWAKHTFELESPPNTTADHKETLVCILTKKPVVRREELFSVILNCHRSIGHGRRDSTWKVVRDGYSWIHREAVNLLISLCPTCNGKSATSRRLPGSQFKKPVLALRFMTRVQLDLLDMSDCPDREYKWVLHCRDHFTKFSWAFPLKTRQADEAAKILQNFIIPYFGAPRILQSNSGKDYVAGVVAELTKRFPIVVIIRGKASHLLVKAYIDRANNDLQQRLDSWLSRNRSDRWSEGLPQIVMAMNNTAVNPGEKAPYEVLFGQKQNADAKLWKEAHRQRQGLVAGAPSGGDNDDNENGDVEVAELPAETNLDVSGKKNAKAGRSGQPATAKAARFVGSHGTGQVAATNCHPPVQREQADTVSQTRLASPPQTHLQSQTTMQTLPSLQLQEAPPHQTKPQLNSQNHSPPVSSVTSEVQQPSLPLPPSSRQQLQQAAPPTLQQQSTPLQMQTQQQTSIPPLAPLPIAPSPQHQLQNHVPDKPDECYYLLQHGEIVARGRKTSFASLHNAKVDLSELAVYSVEAVLTNCQVFPVHVGGTFVGHEPIAIGQYVAWAVAETTKMPQCFAPPPNHPPHHHHHQQQIQEHHRDQPIANGTPSSYAAMRGGTEANKRRKAEHNHNHKLHKLTVAPPAPPPSVQAQQQQQLQTSAYELPGMEAAQLPSSVVDRTGGSSGLISSYYDCFASKNGYYI